MSLLCQASVTSLTLLLAFPRQPDARSRRCGLQLLSRPALSCLWIPFVITVSSTFFCQKAAGGAEGLGLLMERAHLTTLQGPPGVRVGDHLPGVLIHSRSCGSPAGVLPTHLSTLHRGTARGTSSQKLLPFSQIFLWGRLTFAPWASHGLPLGCLSSPTSTAAAETPPGAAAFGPLCSWLSGLKKSKRGGPWWECSTAG